MLCSLKGNKTTVPGDHERGGLVDQNTVSSLRLGLYHFSSHASFFLVHVTGVTGVCGLCVYCYVTGLRFRKMMALWFVKVL